MARHQRALKEIVQHAIGNSHHGRSPVYDFYIKGFAPHDFTQHNAFQLLHRYSG